MNPLLGKQIRALREQCGLTQEQVSGLLSMSRQKYARIENGNNTVKVDILKKLADIFGVRVTDITWVLDEKPELSYRTGGNIEESIAQIYEMLDLFYANKHLYDRMHCDDELGWML